MYIVLIINKMYFFFTNNSLLQSAKMYIVAINKKKTQKQNKINKMPSAQIVMKVQVLHDPN